MRFPTTFFRVVLILTLCGGIGCDPDSEPLASGSTSSESPSDVAENGSEARSEISFAFISRTALTIPVEEHRTPQISTASGGPTIFFKAYTSQGEFAAFTSVADGTASFGSSEAIAYLQITDKDDRFWKASAGTIQVVREADAKVRINFQQVMLVSTGLAEPIGPFDGYVWGEFQSR